MNKHFKRFVLTCGWAGVGLVVAGACMALIGKWGANHFYTFVVAGFLLVLGFTAFVFWCKRNNPKWYESLK